MVKRMLKKSVLLIMGVLIYGVVDGRRLQSTIWPDTNRDSGHRTLPKMRKLNIATYLELLDWFLFRHYWQEDSNAS